MRVAIVMPHGLNGTYSGDRARTAQLVRGLASLGHEVHVIAPSWSVPRGHVETEVSSNYRLVGQGLGFGARYVWRLRLALRRIWDVRALHHSRYLRNSLRDEIARGQFDVVDLQHSYWLIETSAPLVVTVIDVLANPDLDRSGRLKRWVRKGYERRAVQRAAKIVALSEPEASRLEAAYPGCTAKVAVVPVGHPDGAPREIDFDAHSERRGALFIGSMDYAPNWEAAKTLIDLWTTRDVAEELPPLTIAGRSASRLNSPGDRPNITVLSDVPDVSILYERARVAVMPIKRGGGVRLKALEAMAYGVPIIGSALAVDGLGLVDGVSYIRAESEDALVRALTLYSAPDLQSIAQHARSRWEEIGDPAAMATNMISVYEKARYADNITA